jgi:hypothetical protein
MVSRDVLLGTKGATTMLSSVSKKYRAGIVAATVMLAGTSAEAQQTGTVHLNVVNAGFTVSTGSGTGTLSYKGREIGLTSRRSASAPLGYLAPSWWARRTICGLRQTSPAPIER